MDLFTLLVNGFPYFLGALLTVLVLLYLIVGDNALFRMVTYTFIGIAAGYVSILIIFQVLLPRISALIFSPMIFYNVVGLIEIILGLMLFAKLSPRLSGLGTLPVAILLGIGAAVAIGGAVFGTLFGQIRATLNQFPSAGQVLSKPDLLGSLVWGGLTVLGIAGTLAYFQFGVRNREGTPEAAGKRAMPLEILSWIGQIFIGITLGAVFAGVFTAAISALIERIGFLYSLF